MGRGEEISGPPAHRVTHDEFDRYGGVYLRLPPYAQDIGVQAATKYGAEWFTGTTRTVPYPGRWVVRYQLMSKFGGTRSLLTMVGGRVVYAAGRFAPYEEAPRAGR